jgi:hypothetical protein
MAFIAYGAKVTATAYEPDILGIHILLPGEEAK